MRSAGIAFVDQAAVIEDARRVAREMASRHAEIQRVVLIGSFARGAGRPRSDLDLVAIVRASPLGPRERVSVYLPEHPRPIDLVVYTAGEVEAMRGREPPILTEALSRGIDLLSS